MNKYDFKKSQEREIDDKTTKKIFDEVLENMKRENVKLNFINKKEVFRKEGEFYPHKILSDLSSESLGNEKILKVQKLSDLTRIKDMFGTIGDGKHSYWNLGSKSYLFSDEGEIKIKTMNTWISSHESKTKFGRIICKNNGEWGGHLCVINDFEFLAINSHMYSFDGVYEYDGRVFVAERSVHLGGSCSLHEIIKDNNQLILNTIFNCLELNFAGYCFEDNYLYFYSTNLKNGLYRLNLDNYELERIHWRLCSKISVNSLLKHGNYIYIYGNYNLVKYDLNTQDYEVFTNLEYGEITDEMYADGKKLSELWKDLTVEE